MLQVFSQAAAGALIEPERPLSVDALRAWHDRVRGPRDSSGRRIFTAEVCQQIRVAREEARKARAAA